MQSDAGPLVELKIKKPVLEVHGGVAIKHASIGDAALPPTDLVHCTSKILKDYHQGVSSPLFF